MDFFTSVISRSSPQDKNVFIRMPYKSQLHHAIILPFQANGWLSSTNRAVVRVVCAHLPWQGLRDERFSLVSLYLSLWRAPNLSLSSVYINLMIAKRWTSLLPEQNGKSIQNCWLLNSCTAAAVRLLYTSHSRSRYHLFFIPTHCSLESTLRHPSEGGHLG